MSISALRAEVEFLRDALTANGINPDRLCQCLHTHMAGPDGEDEGCRVCLCASWTEALMSPAASAE